MIGTMLAGGTAGRRVTDNSVRPRHVAPLSVSPTDLYRLEDLNLNRYASWQHLFAERFGIQVDLKYFPRDPVPGPFEVVDYSNHYATLLDEKADGKTRPARIEQAKNEVDWLEKLAGKVTDDTVDDIDLLNVRYMTTYVTHARNAGARLASARGRLRAELADIETTYTERVRRVERDYEDDITAMENRWKIEIDNIQKTKIEVGELKGQVKNLATAGALGIGLFAGMPDAEVVKVLVPFLSSAATFVLSGPVKIWWYGRRNRQANNRYFETLAAARGRQSAEIRELEDEELRRENEAGKISENHRSIIHVQTIMATVETADVCYPGSVRWDPKLYPYYANGSLKA
ncbi:MAG: hypothetical protein HY362_04035 [Candidatus Aenigmarchaeota archaeon]|nr:hypothetical protein [Candidatus Aenigmarchaeota archaeon]